MICFCYIVEVISKPKFFLGNKIDENKINKRNIPYHLTYGTRKLFQEEMRETFQSQTNFLCAFIKCITRQANLAVQINLIS